MRIYVSLSFLVLMILTAASARGETIRVAVASNALAASQELAALFFAKTGHKVSLSAASTGKLYAQIVNGAPYDVFMAANEREPLRLVKANLADGDSRMTYAIGRLVLYSTRLPLTAKQGDALLKTELWHRLAIANPRVAPYGIAAREVLEHLALWDKVQQRLIRGENIGQAFYFAQSGNVDLGMVALSQTKAQGDKADGEYWPIPDDWYQPLQQQAVVLTRSQHPSVAKLFLQFLASPRARQLLTETYGYRVVADK